MCRRSGLAARFTTLLTAAVSVLQVLRPGEPEEPLRARADALNWDIDRAVKLLTGRDLRLCNRPTVSPPRRKPCPDGGPNRDVYGNAHTSPRDPSWVEIVPELTSPRRAGRTELTHDITNILRVIGRGDPHAAERLWPLVYRELRRLAGAQMARERPGQTLDATALVHEAYLRLAAHPDPAFANRRHFFAAAANAMRRILVENARRKGREKRGGGRRREFPDLDALQAGGPPDEILALHDALERFAAADPLKAALVELRFFGGLTLSQAAACLDVSPSTADRAWRYARAWLYAAVSGEECDDTPGGEIVGKR